MLDSPQTSVLILPAFTSFAMILERDVSILAFILIKWKHSEHECFHYLFIPEFKASCFASTAVTFIPF
jgi:hypothetical protein